MHLDSSGSWYLALSKKIRFPDGRIIPDCRNEVYGYYLRHAGYQEYDRTLPENVDLITEEDLDDQKMPAALRPHKEKLFGLTIEPERLATIRNERRPNSRYSSLQQCMHEIEEIELMYKRERIPYLNTTAYSVEEISTRIMVTTGLKRHR